MDVNVPPGVEDGQQIRLKGQGKPGAARAGDALINISVTPHQHYMRDGNDIFLELPVTVDEAVQGSKVSVPTAWGPVTMTIPENSNTGTILRLRGKGVAREKSGAERGDQLVELKVVLPEDDEAFKAHIQAWGGGQPHNVREHLKGI